MIRPDRAFEDAHDVERLRDEVEQLRTALEASSDEVSKLAEDRDRLLRRLAAHARDLQAANLAYDRAIAIAGPHADSDLARKKSDEADEELRVAFEELQVLAEELEVANTSLHETNKALDRRVDERTREIQQKNTALSRSERRFRTLVEAMPQLVWQSKPRGHWSWASPQWVDYTGLSEENSRGRGWLRAHHPEDQAIAEDAWAQADAGIPIDFETRIFHVAEGRYRHFRTRATAVADESGTIVEWIGTSTDVDDLLTMQRQQALLVAELQHRTRNLMTVVQSIINRTVRTSTSLEAFAGRIDNRMRALARVQGLLSRRAEGQRIAFDALLREEIEAHVALDGIEATRQVSLSGPADIRLYSSNVQTLALALHELMTNAVKYGALSTPAGHLDITWTASDGAAGNRCLHIDWRERGVSDMPDLSAAPRGGGYGRELIQRALPYQLGAKTSYVFNDDGLYCSIEVNVAAASS